MNPVFRSWCYRFLLAGCVPVAVLGSAFADDETPTDAKPTGTAPAEGGESSNLQGLRKVDFAKPCRSGCKIFSVAKAACAPIQNAS